LRTETLASCWVFCAESTLSSNVVVSFETVMLLYRRFGGNLEAAGGWRFYF
jgi:hypothetical protein